MRFARDLTTEPGNAVYPEAFVERARKAFEGMRDVRIEVLDERAMARLGMRSILAVGEGSARPPRLLVARYTGGATGEAPIAFVGKGITFDSGGISIKPGENMWRMKYDMTGAASSAGAVLALARRGAKVNAIAVAALAENMPSGTAARPGDVVRTASGQTYEIMNTDAEGRMVLVDALSFVQRRDKPRLFIDIATLTGSQVTALGDEYAGLFSRDDALAAQLVAAGAASGEESGDCRCIRPTPKTSNRRSPTCATRAAAVARAPASARSSSAPGCTRAWRGPTSTWPRWPGATMRRCPPCRSARAATACASSTGSSASRWSGRHLERDRRAGRRWRRTAQLASRACSALRMPGMVRVVVERSMLRCSDPRFARNQPSMLGSTGSGHGTGCCRAEHAPLLRPALRQKPAEHARLYESRAWYGLL